MEDSLEGATLRRLVKGLDEIKKHLELRCGHMNADKSIDSRSIEQMEPTRLVIGIDLWRRE